jgi:hypothetical protein
MLTLLYRYTPGIILDPPPPYWYTLSIHRTLYLCDILKYIPDKKEKYGLFGDGTISSDRTLFRDRGDFDREATIFSHASRHRYRDWTCSLPRGILSHKTVWFSLHDDEPSHSVSSPLSRRNDRSTPTFP